MKNRQNVRSIFLSDAHLGCRHCKAEQLLKFLRAYNTEYLYLVGDFIDGWKMKKGIYWTDDHSFIVRRIIGMMKAGTKVVYIAGNHDEFLRNFLPLAFGHLEIVDEIIHATATGEKILILHGDIFDQITMKAKWLYYLGDTAYSMAMWLNTYYNKIRRYFGFPYWSLSLVLKQNVKKAVNFINSFEHYIVKYTKDKKCNGVLCGHIHHSCIKNLEGINYYNCGDWVESCTALIEHRDGRIELYTDNDIK